MGELTNKVALGLHLDAGSSDLLLIETDIVYYPTDDMTLTEKLDALPDTAGDGISITDETISITLSPNSEEWLYLDSTGIGITGIDELAGRVTTVETSVSSIETDITTIEGSISNIETSISAIESNISTIEGSVTTINETLTTMQSNITEIEENITTIEGDITTINETLTTVEGDITTIETNITNIETTITNIESSSSGSYVASVSYDSTAKMIYFYSSDGDTLSTVDATDFIKDGMVSSVELTTTDADGSTGTFIHITFNTDAGTDDIYVDVSSLIDIYTAGDGISVSGDVISAVKSSASEEYLTIDSTGIAVTGVDAIESRVTAAESDIDTLETSVTTINSSITTINTTVNNLSTRMDTAESDIDTLEAAVSTAESDIDNLESAVTALESAATNVTYSADYTTGLNISTITIDGVSTIEYVPYATTEQKGVISVSSGLSVSSGVLTAAVRSVSRSYSSGLGIATYNLSGTSYTMYVPYATTGSYGVVEVGDGLDVTSGVISVDASDFISAAATYESGLSIGSVTIDDTATPYYVPYASATQYGVVMIGTGLDMTSGVVSVDASDVVSASASYTAGLSVSSVTIDDSTVTTYIPYATATQAGVVSVGDGLSVSDGVLSADVADVSVSMGYSTGMALGTVTINGTAYTVYVPYATTTSYGVIEVGAGLDVTSGVISVAASDVVSVSSNYTSGLGIGSVTVDGVTSTLYVPYATTTSYGTVMVGSGLDVSSGVISVDASDVVSVSATYSSGLSVSTVTVDSSDTEVYVPYATTSTTGVVYVGDGLEIDEEGKLTAVVRDVTRKYSSGLIIATYNVSGISYNLDVPYMTESSGGVAKIGDGLSIDDNGVLSVDNDTVTSEMTESLNLEWTEFD